MPAVVMLDLSEASFLTLFLMGEPLLDAVSLPRWSYDGRISKTDGLVVLIVSIS